MRIVKGDVTKVPSTSTYKAYVKRFIQEVLGHRYSSHSFRVEIITDM
ncbi:hypothetical protein KO488_08140 [Poseidonibacter lekithochrous]|nr:MULTISPECIES: hypothetical protein [Poseidonibacter]MBU3014723.1 hypothetical protein [Poseidonibacter lekithochrous]MDO6828021.1 hypothetical protein [Poseidonibacter sp. 1_MG-2023]